MKTSSGSEESSWSVEEEDVPKKRKNSNINQSMKEPSNGFGGVNELAQRAIFDLILGVLETFR